MVDAAQTGHSARRTPGERHRAIVEEAARAGGFLTVAVLADRLGVSPMTIRRDLEALERLGEVQRTRGGVLTSAGQALFGEPPFLERQQDNPDAKRLLAASAARLVRPGQTIGLDVGTTTLELARHLGGIADLTVITTSLPVAGVLAPGGVAVYLPGGRVRPHELSLVGARAREGVAAYNLDLFFLGMASLDAEGAYDYSIEDAEVKQVFIEHARQVVALCDSSKFGGRSVATVARLSDIDVLVTEREPDRPLAERLEREGVEVVVAAGEHL